MDITALLIKTIIEEQQTLIGPLALEEANKVDGLIVSDNLQEINFKRDGREILEDLVEQYKRLFGQASVEVCKDAIREIGSQVKPSEIPDFLK